MDAFGEPETKVRSAHARELEEELEAARREAVRLRAEQGAYTGAIQIENFCLPNPGGGANLIDEGEFNLVPGEPRHATCTIPYCIVLN